MPDKRPKPVKIPHRPPLPAFPIVAIGASAGGLDACTRLIGSLPARTGMAFILIQHLDPNHESMMADLLAKHTSMTVAQASDGDTIAPEHVYIIPPGTYLSVAGGKLRLSTPGARHGAMIIVRQTLGWSKGTGFARFQIGEWRRPMQDAIKNTGPASAAKPRS